MPLDNSKTGESVNSSRNIGCVRVVKNFKDVSSSAIISDDLMIDKTNPESGGFYSFGGQWTAQRNVGVNWITKHDDVENLNVTRLKACKLNKETILIYEQWTKDN